VTVRMLARRSLAGASGAKDMGIRREEEMRPRQRVKGHGASSLARVQGRMRSVSSGGRRRTDARQVFDETSLTRARS
jgi:hypothetical protein